MAFRTQQFTKAGSPCPSYNVDWSVGAGGINSALDVKLVQALLRMAYYELPKRPGVVPPPGASLIAVDGIAGAQTRKHIMAFQQGLKADGAPILVDGKMDPFRKQGELSHLAKVMYSLEKLNDYCFVVSREEGLDWYEKLTQRPYVYPHKDLVAALSAEYRMVARQYQYQAPQPVPSTGGA